MALFDCYLMVDWSASSRPAHGKDSIWWALAARDGTAVVLRDARNPRTRAEAKKQIIGILSRCRAQGRRILVGFDFPFGYPRGAALRIAGEARWSALWRLLAERIEDHPDNKNNRFSVAAGINRACFDAAGPFWGHPHQHSHAGLRPTKPTGYGSGLYPSERRHVENRLRGAKAVWQLYGQGSVGSQALLGIPFVERLRHDAVIAGHVAIWPFETGLCSPQDRRIIVVEIYPSAFQVTLEPDEVNDRAQVRTLALTFAALDGEGELAPAFELSHVTNDTLRCEIVAEEGWILGEGLPATMPVLARGTR
jgi:precorrin-8X/cobalt-precorrin-8 methylmutase